MFFYLGVTQMKRDGPAKLEADFVVVWKKNAGDGVPWRLCRLTDGEQPYYAPYLLVRDIGGNQELVELFSYAKSRVTNRAGRYKEDLVHGYLMWYPCDAYGKRILSQPPIYIKRVPDENYKRKATKIWAAHEEDQRFVPQLSRDVDDWTPPTFDAVMSKLKLWNESEEDQHGEERKPVRFRFALVRGCERPYGTEERIDVPELGLGVGGGEESIP